MNGDSPRAGAREGGQSPFDALRRYAPLGVGAAIAAAAGTGVIDINLPPWGVEMLKQWGPAGILLCGVVYYVPRDTVPRSVKAQQDQAVAMGRIGDQLQVLNGQSGKLDEILAKIEDVKFDNGIFADRLTRIEERLLNDRRSDDL